MYALNLPSFDAKIRKKKDGFEIFDPLRRKYLTLTPEEWVRQHFVHFLIDDKNYPASRIVNEGAIKLNSMTRRCDTVVYNHRLEPVVIAEYKEPGVTITQQVFDQVARYNSVLRVPYIMISNGISHYCYRIDYKTMSYTFLTDIPMYGEL